MMSQVAVEALYSATYVETYLDAVENLPDDVQRLLSRIREIDVQYRAYLRDVDILYEQWSHSELELMNSSKKTRSMARIQQCLIAAQELGDEKLQIVTQLQELIDQKTRQLDLDFKNLDYSKDEPILEIKEHHVSSSSPTLNSPINNIIAQPVSSTTTSVGAVSSSIGQNNLMSERAIPTNSNANGNERSSKRARRTRTETNSSSVNISGGGNIGMDMNSDSPLIMDTAIKPITTQSNISIQKKGSTASNSSGGKKKKRKTRGASAQSNISSQVITRDNRDDTPPVEEPIDPDEPTYCLCDQISFGEMILCDNDLCPIEWFHFSCVSLMSKPKGKWFCPNCRGDRPNVMKPKAQFLKELERYNKEKEEKT